MHIFFSFMYTAKKHSTADNYNNLITFFTIIRCFIQTMKYLFKCLNFHFQPLNSKRDKSLLKSY